MKSMRTLIRKHKQLAIVILIIVVGASLGIGYSYFKLYQSPVDETTSQRNIQLMINAIGWHNLSTCDQITGGINATSSSDSLLRGLSGAGVSLKMPAMTEAQARAMCRENVQLVINRDAYGKKVCADKITTRFSYNNTTFSCSIYNDR